MVLNKNHKSNIVKTLKYLNDIFQAIYTKYILSLKKKRKLGKFHVTILFNME